MRIKLNNRTDRPDEEILPLIELAASVVNVRGVVHVSVGWTRRRDWGGWSYYTRPTKILVQSILVQSCRPAKFVEHEATELGYFRANQIPLRKPYKYTCWQDIIVGVAAHEFAHLMKRGRVFRKSVIELFCEEKCADALALYQSDMGKQRVQMATDALRARRLEKEGAVEKRKNPDARRDRLLLLQKRWMSKSKRATNALRKIEIQIRRLDRRMAAKEGGK